MTETQKEQIRAMRMQGIGYRLIANELGLKINQVQLFCKAHGLAGPGELTRLLRTVPYTILPNEKRDGGLKL